MDTWVVKCGYFNKFSELMTKLNELMNIYKCIF